MILGNANLSGFVNFVAEGRFVVGTGSYTKKDNTKVFKDSVTVFTDAAYDGIKPAKGDYVKLSGDINVSKRKDVEGLQATINVRFANQVVKTDAPVAKAKAPAENAEI